MSDRDVNVHGDEVIKLPNNVEIEAWYDPSRERIVVKVRRCPTGEIRDGKQGVIMATTLDGMFDVAEGQEYPYVCNHNMSSKTVRDPVG